MGHKSPRLRRTSRDTFNDRSERQVCCYDSRYAEPRCRIQRFKLCFRSLATARTHQHVDIVGSCPLACLSLIDTRRVDPFYNQQLRGRAHDLTTVLQDRNRTIVVPIVDDMLQKVSIGAPRHCRKKIATHCFAAVGKTGLAQSLARSFDDLWKIEQSPLQRRIGSKNSREQGTIAAAYIDYVVNSREVIGRDDSGGYVCREPSHCRIEVGGLLRVLREERERVLAEDPVEGRFTGFDAVKQIAPGALRDAPEQQRGGSHRSRHA